MKLWVGKLWAFTSAILVCVLISLPLQAQSDVACATNKASNGEAFYKLGKQYAKGQGLAQDYAKAATLFRLSAEQGCALAQNDLAVLYANGQGVKQDFTEAIKWFRLAATNGDPLAQYSLGLFYSLGLGVTVDFHAALLWWNKAAAQNQGDAMLALGQLYLNGAAGITVDYLAARKWLEKAAAAGCVTAYNSLGFIFEHGAPGVPRDVGEAVKCFRRGAEQGEPQAQMNLGRMCLDGVGMPPDLVEAYQWFYLSSLGKNLIARHYVNELEGKNLSGIPRLTAGQIEEGRRRASRFKKTSHPQTSAD